MNTPALTVYLLCFLTSLACLFLLARSYFRTRHKLLLWSALCFVGLATNNLLVVVDLSILRTQVDLSLVRAIANIAAVAILLYGFIWDAD